MSLLIFRIRFIILYHGYPTITIIHALYLI
nr:MAG TPA: hypothetical protein [Caudoviricetes sp.]